MHKLEGKSLDITQKNIQALKQFFPEIVTEGKIDFDKLKAVLGEEIESRKEKYEFTWHGKTQALKLAQTPSTGTLRPDKASSKNWDTTENLYIEGDNLEVLKLLQKSYFGKVKMIYIDPPYNTGQDFVYKDNFRDNIKNYKEITEQTKKANTESNGRFHTDWLNMMYPRLKQARNLLTEDGIIFVSIDDNEVGNLRLMLNEIFGEYNFLGEFVWQSKKGGGGDVSNVVIDHQYIVCYAKNIESEPVSKISVEAEPLDQMDEKGPYRKGRELNKWGSNSSRQDRPTMFFSIPGPQGEDVYPIRNDGSEGCWRWGKPKMLEVVANGDVLFERREDSTYIVYEKIRSTEPRKKPYRTWLPEVGTNSEGTEAVKAIFNSSLFDFPKPISLLEHLINIGGKEKNSIIMDFFSGSASTAHALMNINAQNGGNQKFIMIQLPELIDENSEANKAGYKNICEIGKERIRRAGDSIAEETGKTDLDIGFKVFKLDSSNVKPWDPDLENLEEGMLEQLENIKADRSKEDLLFEILLKIGIPLTTQIEEMDWNGKTIYNVAYGSVLLCLENDIDLDIVHQMMKYKSDVMDTKVIFKESGFLNDSVKTNAIQTLKKNGINDVRSV